MEYLSIYVFILDDESNLYEIHSARRDALSNWLSEVTTYQIERDVETQKMQVRSLHLYFKMIILNL